MSPVDAVASGSEEWEAEDAALSHRDLASQRVGSFRRQLLRDPSAWSRLPTGSSYRQARQEVWASLLLDGYLCDVVATGPHGRLCLYFDDEARAPGLVIMTTR